MVSIKNDETNSHIVDESYIGRENESIINQSINQSVIARAFTELSMDTSYEIVNALLSVGLVALYAQTFGTTKSKKYDEL